MSMYYQGDLQSGIALAIHESKSVVCFVKDDGKESAQWEEEWLQDQNIPATLAKRAVTFSIEAGSEEAGMLSQFCTLSQIPALVVIYQGQLVEQLSVGISKNDFTLRLLRNLSQETRPSPASQQPLTSSSQAQTRSQAPEASPPSQTPTAGQDTGPRSALNDVYAERRKRIETERKARADAEKAAAKERKSERTEAESAAAAEARKRKQEANAERDRVRKRVEDDKAERRRREEQRKLDREAAAAAAEASNMAEFEPGSTPSASATAPRANGSTASCALQIRLTDGSTIRNRFSANDTLSSAVRPWIESQRTDGHVPFTLKQIVAPSPSRKIGDADEHKSLAEIGFAPSASLIMVPAPGSIASAYHSSSVGSVTAAGTMIYGQLAGFVEFIVNAVKTFLGLNQAPAATGSATEATELRRIRDTGTEETVGDGGAATSASSTATHGSTGGSGGSGIRIRTLRDQKDAKDSNQLYNGNQLNFEPNTNDDDEDDE